MTSSPFTRSLASHLSAARFPPGPPRVVALPLALLLLVLAVAPAGAHPPTGLGIPKHHCERPEDRKVHEYVAGPSLLVAAVQDGNVLDCDGDLDFFDHDGHREFGIGGALLEGGHHGTRVCVVDSLYGTVPFSVNGAGYPGPCADVEPAESYLVAVFGGSTGHIWTD